VVISRRGAGHTGGPVRSRGNESAYENASKIDPRCFADTFSATRDSGICRAINWCVLKSCDNQRIIASGRSSIQAVRPALHNHRLALGIVALFYTDCWTSLRSLPALVKYIFTRG